MSTSTDRPVFRSVLYDVSNGTSPHLASEAPEYFHDLNLDQVVEAIVAERDEYELRPFFYTPLQSVETVLYRHEIMRDLEEPANLEAIRDFAEHMRTVRATVTRANKLYYKYQRLRWFMHAVDLYCSAVQAFAKTLAELSLRSRGLSALRSYVRDYANADRLTSMMSESAQVSEQLGTVRYEILIKDTGFKVRKYEAEPDYSIEVAATFEKFRQGDVKDYRANFSAGLEMNHIEAQVLAFVALLFPEEFASLDRFCSTYQSFVDPTLERYDREIQFYVAYLDYVQTFKAADLGFCYPTLSDTDKEVRSTESFDLALGAKLVAVKATVVCNDFELAGKERILVVSGPNNGGKTTLARTFGQLHHFASLGCPVPGSQAKLFLFDRLFTHFEREENIETLRGKLQDDLVRIHDIIEKATANSIVIMNEIFTSTTLQDAVFLGRRVIEEISDLDAIAVCVTFLDELASLSEKTVSMVSTVDEHDPAVRTFKVIRRPADGNAYAIAVAQKYGLTYDQLKGRIAS